MLVCFHSLTGFALLQAGSVTLRSQANIFYKSVADIVVGGSAYWLFGYGLGFGMGPASNGFIGVGDFALNVIDNNKTGFTLVNYVFQVYKNKDT